MSDDDIQKMVRKGAYAEMMAGMDLRDQVALLKKTFGEVLLNEEGMEEVEYNARLGL